MIENSSAGLVMLGAEVTVTVTREERHQSALSGYPVAAGQQRHVAVELGWGTVSSGKYRGEPAIEVRLDGQRVGELTYLMSQRYAPVVAQVAARGDKPGCEAVIQRGSKGLEVVLRLPRDTEGVVPAVPPTRFTTPVSFPAPVMTPAPAVPVPPVPPRRRLFASHRPAWIAAAVVAVAFFAALANADDDSPASVTAHNDVATTIATTTRPPVTTTQPTTTTVAPSPPPPPQAPPPPAPKTTPKPAAPAPPPPVAEPAPQPACDPNYTGCVPKASDVDCLGGTGDGPAYVAGPINVIGTDIYKLDHDRDGIACE